SYPGDPEVMAAWCEELAVPLVIMGGELSGGPAEVVEQVGQAVAAGARGVVIGRNLWQRPPEVTRELVAAVYQILHGRPAVALATV
ncbi:MAG: class I fructose-bisphosphate aldolase, partial [Acidimicrobiales bacterium]